MFSLGLGIYNEIKDNNRKKRVKEYLLRKGKTNKEIDGIIGILELSGCSEDQWKNIRESDPNYNENTKNNILKTALVLFTDRELSHAWFNDKNIEEKIAKGIDELVNDANNNSKTSSELDKGSPSNLNKICPFCAEEIKWEAIVCRYCGRDLPIGEKEDNSPLVVISEELNEIITRLEDINLPTDIDIKISEPGEEILFFSQTIMKTTIESLGIFSKKYDINDLNNKFIIIIKGKILDCYKVGYEFGNKGKDKITSEQSAHIIPIRANELMKNSINQFTSEISRILDSTVERGICTRDNANSLITHLEQLFLKAGANAYWYGLKLFTEESNK